MQCQTAPVIPTDQLPLVDDELKSDKLERVENGIPIGLVMIFQQQITKATSNFHDFWNCKYRIRNHVGRQ